MQRIWRKFYLSVVNKVGGDFLCTVYLISKSPACLTELPKSPHDTEWDFKGPIGRWADPVGTQSPHMAMTNELPDQKHIVWKVLSHVYKKKAGAPGSSAFPTVQCVHWRTTSALCKVRSWTTPWRTWPTRGHTLDSSPFRAEPLTWKVQTEQRYLDTFSTTSLDTLRRGSQQFPLLRSESRTCSGHLKKMRKQPQCVERGWFHCCPHWLCDLVILVTYVIYKMKIFLLPFQSLYEDQIQLYNYSVTIKDWTNVRF